MSLETDIIVDRRRLKRRLIFWRVLGVVALTALALFALGRFDLGEKLGVGDDHVVRIEVDGLILADRARDEALVDVEEDDKAKALIVAIDSPGGTFVGGEVLYGRLRKIAEKKPVVAMMGGTATSAAYMAAIGTDRIYARAGSLTGSIGVILQTADITGLLEKLGIKPETVKSGPLKAQPNPMEPFTPEARRATEEVIQDLHGLFIDMVAERREMDRAKIVDLADGRLFSGRRALEAGLIDAVGEEEDIRKWLSETHDIADDLPVVDVEVKHKGEPWRDYLGSVIRKALFSERLRLDGVISLWHPGGKF